MDLNDLTYVIRGAIFEANRVLGAGFLEKVEVKDIGRNRSSFLMEGRYYTAFHDVLDDHVFTVVKG
jgi:hypothetical protein